MAVNCAAIPKDLMESELFGHETGRLHGRVDASSRLCGAGRDGILFLDEIGELEPASCRRSCCV